MNKKKDPKPKQFPKKGEDLGPKVSLSVNDLLRISFLSGTSGSARIAATTKAGLATDLTPTAGLAAYNIRQQMVAKIKFVPTLGALWNDSQRMALFNALYEYYTFIRSRNASLSSYSQFDVYKVLFAVSQLYMMLGHARQKMRSLFTDTSAVNAAVPNFIRDAYGVSANDKKYINQYISQFNRIVKALKGLFVPGDFKLGLRHLALVSTIYKDDPLIAKSQYIVFVPSKYFKLDVSATSPTVGQLVSVDVPSTLDQLLSDLESLVNQYTLDTDVNNIYAEMRKAYSDSVERLSIIEFNLDGEPLECEFSQILIDQLRNATLCGVIDKFNILEDTATGFLKYSTTYIGCHPCTVLDNEAQVDLTLRNFGALQEVINPSTTILPIPPYENGWAMGQTYVNCHDDQPDEDNMALLLYWKARLGYAKYFPEKGSSQVAIYSHTTEVLEYVEIYGAQTCVTTGILASTDRYPDFIYSSFMSFNADGAGATNRFIYTLEVYHSFASLPMITAGVYDTSDPATDDDAAVAIIGDIDNLFTAPWRAVDECQIASTQGIIASHFKE